MQLVGTTANGNLKTLTNLQQSVYDCPVYSGHPVYNGRGNPLYFLNPQFHCLLTPVYNGQEIVLRLANNDSLYS